MSPLGRAQDVDAIVRVIQNAEKFIHIAVMDYIPMEIYSPKTKSVHFHITRNAHRAYTLRHIVIDFVFFNRRYWPVIDDALRSAALVNKVEIKLLISWWNHSRPAEDFFLRSLEALSQSYKGVSVQVVSIVDQTHFLLVSI